MASKNSAIKRDYIDIVITRALIFLVIKIIELLELLHVNNT